MEKIRQLKCKNCKEKFTPDYRNTKRQNYCSKPECRKASKKASQQKWLNKPENKDHFKGPENVLRVQEWRKANPGYSRRKKDALQDRCQENSNKNQTDNGVLGDEIRLSEDALQELCQLQPAVIIGLIASFTGSVLQDDIVKTLQRMQNIGTDILNGLFLIQKGGQNGKKTGYLPGTNSKSSKTIQLGGSPTGP